jgi:hypothetical protein
MANIFFMDSTCMYGTTISPLPQLVSGSNNNVIAHVKHKWKGSLQGGASEGFGGVMNLAAGRWGANTRSIGIVGNTSVNSYGTIAFPREFGFTNATPLAERVHVNIAFGFAVKSLGFSLDPDPQSEVYQTTLDNPTAWITLYSQEGFPVLAITLNTSGTKPLKVFVLNGGGSGVLIGEADCTVSASNFDYFEVKMNYAVTDGTIEIKQNGTIIFSYIGQTIAQEAYKIKYLTVASCNELFRGLYTDFYVADDFVPSGYTSRVWAQPFVDQGEVKQFANQDNSPKNHDHVNETLRDSDDYIYPSLHRKIIDTYRIDQPVSTGGGPLGLIHGVALNLGMTGSQATPLKGLFWKVASDTPYEFSGYVVGTPNYQVVQHINARIPFAEFYWRQVDFASGYGEIGIMYNA